MKDKTILRYKSNERIMTLLYLLDQIAWESVRDSSVHRILYLAKMMFSFVHADKDNILAEYDFSVSVSGPFSDLVHKSLTDLLSRAYIEKDNEGNIRLVKDTRSSEFDIQEFIDWIKVIVYILGLYGEDKIYGFAVRDATYENAMARNSVQILDGSKENKTIELLNRFKEAFENTLEDTSAISKKEYLELYFEYVFSVIIKEKLK
ncbi:MAG: hypothetical protein ACRBFS_08130 [Aureispira sp.]